MVASTPASTPASTRARTTGITAGFVGAVGNTPLIRLNALSALTGCEILGKAEFMNPGGSVKDRAALGILLEAEEQGLLKPGGTVVEGTAGNTGIGLTHLCNARGYKALIVIPDTQSAEKIGLLRSLGAEVRTVPAVPYRDPNNYVRLSGRIAEETPGAVWANQFDNLANRRAHYNATGPEIWQQTAGRVDAWGGGHRHRWYLRRCGALSEGAEPSRALRAGRPSRQLPLQLGHRWIPGERGQLDHRGHRQQPRHRQPGRGPGRRRRACCRSGRPRHHL
jgi:hypothetical protein